MMKTLFRLFQRILAMLSFLSFIALRFIVPFGVTFLLLTLVLLILNDYFLSDKLLSLPLTIPSWGIITLQYLSPQSWSGVLLYLTIASVSEYFTPEDSYFPNLFPGIFIYVLHSILYLIVALQSSIQDLPIITISICLGMLPILLAEVQDTRNKRSIKIGCTFLLELTRSLWENDGKIYK